ncbi:MAG TPA: hypothetical protein VN520_01615, partial [Streptomyces sp.]|uniref:hypothetical protein n=1 Tax=Streptomyces sp. TaxID=1931 RepID=UPI002C915E06
MSRTRTEHNDPVGRPLPPRLDPRAGRPPRATTAREDQSARRSRGATAVRVVAGLLAVALLGTSGW